MASMEDRKCPICGTQLTRQKTVCSRSCRNKLYTIKGYKQSEEHIEKRIKPLRGSKRPDLTLRNIINNPTKHGKDNPNWKGDDVGYIAIHNWAHRYVGLKNECEKCGSEIKLEMANKSHQYKRELDDWWTLCRKCHLEIDLEFRRNGGVSRKLHKWKKKNSQ